ncbi:helicase HerA-like domain-containing protein [Nocardioides sp. SYSU D00065]|uniref:helicase HerA-like domain-containing protein n=1 Tax=Nocardioides sp. SYSU D00065 TaxID=2817378 RepID=UPI001B324495|nr:helicase HerA-like domain-containing protein [Nocardioides sp. SYSU D00065]
MSETSEAPPAATDPIVAAVAPGYRFEGDALELGGLMLDAETLSDVRIRIPLGMLNRHGLVAGATGTGKTKTLQLLAEQLSAHGVPVFAADIKGDLSGLGVPGAPDDKITARSASVGQQWTATGFPTELFSIGGEGVGVPVRVTMSAFGPTLLAKVLGLNETQESSLALVFYYCDKNGLPLLDLADLRAVLQYLTGDPAGKAELKAIGGVSPQTAGVILRELVAFEAQGADVFFGEPELDTKEFLRTTDDGRGVISLLELPHLQDRPALFSTFLMWMLADLFHDLPEEGDLDKPKLVFFFDEAHLLFDDASEAFLDQVAQTVRLIRSKGVGVFFVTQSPTDVPDEVLAQLGSRIQHQLRAHTPNDAKALRATVDTYPESAYDDLGEVITSLGIGEAVVTVMNERGAPTPVAWTRLRAPESLMDPAPAEQMAAAVAASPLTARYAEPIDRESARELLAAKLEEGARKAAEDARVEELAREQRNARVTKKAPAKKAPAPRSSRSQEADDGMLESVVKSPVFKDFMRTAAREIARGMFKSGRR